MARFCGGRSRTDGALPDDRRSRSRREPCRRESAAPSCERVRRASRTSGGRSARRTSGPRVPPPRPSGAATASARNRRENGPPDSLSLARTGVYRLQRTGPRAGNARLCDSWMWAIWRFVFSPAIVAPSSLRLNRKAAPGGNTSETKVPRPALGSSRGPIGLPLPREGRDAAAGAGAAQGDRARVQMLQRSPLLARPARLRLQPVREPVRERIQLARPLRPPERRLHRARPQVLADGVARRPGPPRDLPNAQPIPQRRASDHAQ